MLDKFGITRESPDTNIASAKLKLDELFLTWISSANVITHVEKLVSTANTTSTTNGDNIEEQEHSPHATRKQKVTSSSPKRCIPEPCYWLIGILYFVSRSLHCYTIIDFL